MSFWYLPTPEELFLDLDDYMRPAPSKSGDSRGPWGEIFFRRRLADAIRADRLPVASVYLDHSATARHWHAIVKLRRTMPLVERLVWQLRLGSDLMRGQADLMRAVRGVDSPSLLIRSTPMADFYREPDRVCGCTRKHDTREQAQLNGSACPVWKELRGMTPYELFGPTLKCHHRALPLPIGEVPLGMILAVYTGEKKNVKQQFEEVEFCLAAGAAWSRQDVRCFQCDLPIFGGSKIVRAFYEPGAAAVYFHRQCWQEEGEEEA